MNTFKLIRHMAATLGYGRSGIIGMLQDGDITVETYENAEQIAKSYIEESVWAFRASFIASHCETDIPEEMITTYQEKHCEDANETLKGMISDFDDFVEDAISADGIGHFLPTFDNNAYEYREGDTLYLYWIG